MTQQQKQSTNAATLILDRAEQIARAIHPATNEWPQYKSFWDQFSQNYQSELIIEAVEEAMEDPESNRELYSADSKIPINGSELYLHAIIQGLANHHHLEAVYEARELVEDNAIRDLSDLEGHEVPDVLDENELEQIILGEETQVLDATTLEVSFEASFNTHDLYGKQGSGPFQVTQHIDRILILLSTGGPASRAVVDFNDAEAWIEVSDWGTGWVRLKTLSDNVYDLLKGWSLPEAYDIA